MLKNTFRSHSRVNILIKLLVLLPSNLKGVLILGITFRRAISIYDSFMFSNQDLLGGETTKRYLTYINAFKAFLSKYNIKLIDDITPSHLLNFCLNLNTNLKVQTVNCYKSALKSFFKILHHLGYMDTDPAVHIKMEFDYEDDFYPALTLQEIQAVRDEVLKIKDIDTRYTYYVAFVVFSLAGLRCSEIANLCIKDIDFSRNQLFIIDSKFGNDRVVPLPCKVSRLLFDYIKWKKITDTETSLFSKTKHRYTMMFKKFYRRAGVNDKCTLHSLRRTFATLLYKNKVPVEIIQELLGHKCLDTTYRYIELDKEESLFKTRSLYETYFNNSEVEDNEENKTVKSN